MSQEAFLFYQAAIVNKNLFLKTCLVKLKNYVILGQLGTQANIHTGLMWGEI